MCTTSVTMHEKLSTLVEYHGYLKYQSIAKAKTPSLKDRLRYETPVGPMSIAHGQEGIIRLRLNCIQGSPLYYQCKYRILSAYSLLIATE